MEIKPMDIIALVVVIYIFFLVMMTIFRGEHWLKRKSRCGLPVNKVVSEDEEMGDAKK